MATQVTLNSLHKDIRSLQREIHQIKEAVVDKKLTDDDMEFIRRTRQAQKDIDEGKGVTRTVDEFLVHLDKLKHEKKHQELAAV